MSEIIEATAVEVADAVAEPTPVSETVETKLPVAVESEPPKSLTVHAEEQSKIGMWSGGQAFAEASRMAKVLSMTPMVPQTYRGQPGNCLIALDMAQRMGMSPMMIMQNLYIVNGNPGWSGQACIALINNCGRFEAVKFDEHMSEDGDFSCTAYAKERKTGEVVYGTTVNRQMAKDCGWLDKNGSYWQKMPMQMARYRAAAFFARAYCPESLMGLYTDTELMDIHGYPEANEN